MALTTENRVDELLREELQRRRVLMYVDAMDTFVTPEGTLLEVVVRDASMLEEARRAVQDVERRLEGEGVSVLPTVRALWQVEDVNRVEISNPPGTPSEMVGALFKARLKSGAQRQDVWVVVTFSALQVLRPLITSDDALTHLVSTFLQHRLSVGGAGHWDPARTPRLEIDNDAARYLRWRPYEQLRRSVDQVFGSEDNATGYLRLFEPAGKRARDINDALAELPGPGGAFSRGERLPTSNHELYGMLLASEKEEWKRYYAGKLKQACEAWPQLQQKFPSALRQ